MSPDQILRQYVRALLQEDDTGGVYTDLSVADAGANPYGMSFGSGEDLYNVFVRPFTDVVGVAAGKTKEISQKTQTLLHVAFEAVATTVVPVLRDDYAEIFEHEKDEIDKIRREYHDVFARTWDAFKDHDVMLLAFLRSPASFITQRLIKQSPKVAVGLLSVLSGGSLDPWLDKIKAKFGLDDKETSTANVDVHGPENSGPIESVIREDKTPSLAELLTSDNVKQRLAQSDVVRKLQQRGTALERNTLKQVYAKASGVMRAKTLEDLQHAIGKPLKGVDKLRGVPQQERGPAEQQVLQATKKSMLSFYVKNLEAQAKKAVDEGAPHDCAYVQDYQRVISKIKAL